MAFNQLFSLFGDLDGESFTIPITRAETHDLSPLSPEEERQIRFLKQNSAQPRVFQVPTVRIATRTGDDEAFARFLSSTPTIRNVNPVESAAVKIAQLTERLVQMEKRLAKLEKQQEKPQTVNNTPSRQPKITSEDVKFLEKMSEKLGTRDFTADEFARYCSLIESMCEAPQKEASKAKSDSLMTNDQFVTGRKLSDIPTFQGELTMETLRYANNMLSEISKGSTFTEDAFVRFYSILKAYGK